MRDLIKKDSQSPAAATSTTQAHEGAEVKRVNSDALLAGQKELIIEHGAEEYRLRKTRQGKLILTK